jgi:hypothetical protein
VIFGEVPDVATWEIYDPQDFILMHSDRGRGVTHAALYYAKDIPEPVARGAPWYEYATTPVAWATHDAYTGTEGYNLPFIEVWREMSKRTKIEMAGDCLAAAFSYWSTASEGERRGLIPQLREEFPGLSEFLFEELNAAIPAPTTPRTSEPACVSFFRGYRNRFYAQGKRHSRKAPLSSVEPNARQLVLKRAAAALRECVTKWADPAALGLNVNNDGVRTQQAKWGNPVFLTIADELENMPTRTMDDDVR